ncbi:MAG TPA: CPBP family intramembrane glutamic endopeptidase, partial [Candidatus Dormibacteraeota bacterium]|nr:CPBP family intramembrane glutamic endopeptidase [Candidatus Dormibacteraeota bacterium]
MILLAATVARAAIGASGLGQVAAAFAFGGLLLAMWSGAHLTGAVRFPVEIDFRPRALLAGLAVAALLLAPGLWLRATGNPTRLDLFGPGFYLPLVPALLWIAPAEELFLRGLLQPAIRSVAGPGAAILLVAVLFAAIHLPAYGWMAMPLDLGVGLVLGWLREELRSVTACVAAHTL